LLFQNVKEPVVTGLRLQNYSRFHHIPIPALKHFRTAGNIDLTILSCSVFYSKKQTEMNENNYIEEYRKLFNMDKEKAVYEETLSMLQRATKAHEVAEAVAKLFDVSSINSELVVKGSFIEILIGIAANLRKGSSVNNLREHINSVIARDKWKVRERESRESRPFKINGDTITVNFSVTFDRDKFALLQDIIHQMDMTLSRVTVSHFDGNPETATPVYQLQGASVSVAAALRKIHDNIGADALFDIRYTSGAYGFERTHLTLSQTIQLAENEY